MLPWWLWTGSDTDVLSHCECIERTAPRPPPQPYPTLAKTNLKDLKDLKWIWLVKVILVKLGWIMAPIERVMRPCCPGGWPE